MLMWLFAKSTKSNGLLSVSDLKKLVFQTTTVLWSYRYIQHQDQQQRTTATVKEVTTPLHHLTVTEHASTPSQPPVFYEGVIKRNDVLLAMLKSSDGEPRVVSAHASKATFVFC